MVYQARWVSQSLPIPERSWFVKFVKSELNSLSRCAPSRRYAFENQHQRQPVIADVGAHLDQLHCLSVDIPKLLVAIHLKKHKISDSCFQYRLVFYCYLEKHILLLGEVDDIFALI